MLTDRGADVTMLVHVGVALAFGGTGAREGDACGELRLQKLPVSNLVGTGQNTAGRGANSGAIVIEPDACDHPLHMLLCEACIGTGGTGLYATEAGIDAFADRIGMARLVRMRTKHRSDGNGGHEHLPCERACRTTRRAGLGSMPDKVPHLDLLGKSSCREQFGLLTESMRCRS
jgi:hypothetical protein